MNLSDYFHAYSLDELAQGAECCYSGDLEQFSSEILSESEYTRCVEEGVLFPFQNHGEVQFSSASCKKVTWNGGGKEYYHPRIWFFERLGRIGGVRCDCDAFKKDFYFCPHTAALLTQMMLDRYGDDVFQGTLLEERLRRLTNTEDPFQPGALRHTDERILSLLNEAPAAALPKWYDRPENQSENLPPFQIECIIGTNPSSTSKTLELRFGPGKLYVVTDLPALLHAYQYQIPYQFGRREAVILPQNCEPFARKVLDCLLELENGDAFSASLFLASKRQLILSESFFQKLMQVCDRHSIFLNQQERAIAVDLNRKGLHSVLRKTDYGAILRPKRVQIFHQSMFSLYLLDQQGMFAVQLPSQEQTSMISMLVTCTESLYIRQSDLNRIFRELVPLLRKCGELRLIGMDEADSAIEKPEFRFELDYENGTLFCTPYSIYPRQGLTCRLFDENDAAALRDGEAEGKAAEMLSESFRVLNKETGTLSVKLGEEALFRFMRDIFPSFEQLGSVMVTDSLRASRVRTLPKVSIGISVHGNNLLMSLKGGNLTRKEMDGVLSAYRKRKKYYRLKSGEFLSLEMESNGTWDTLSELYEHYGKKNPDKMLLPLHRALYLQEMLEKRADTLFDAGEDYRSLLSAMQDVNELRYPIPTQLSGILRPYQAEGCRWIQMLKSCGFGGILADDMGLGKTLQVLSFLHAEKEQGKSGDELRTLIVCPASLVYNWQKEINRFTPELSSVVIAGTVAERKELLKKCGQIDIWITSYDLLKRDIALYENLSFANEIVDEAQFIKNQNTQAAQSVRLISSRFRMALTGTPMENHLGELWSILDYLMPGFFDTYASFQREYEIPIAAENNETQLNRLRKLIHPFILRRLKTEVLKELPEKQEEVVTVRLEGEQMQLYQAAVAEVRQTLDSASQEEFEHSKLKILAQLTRLRQICCDPALVFEGYRGGSAKLETCIQLIQQAVEGGHKLLLFSQFTSMLDIICKRLKEEKIAYHRIDGTVSKEDRMMMVDSFADDEVPVFCISLKAGGTGLNLTAADIVIHYDPWWNQAAQNQATDRAHRIGQTQRVNVYELIAQDTIEDQIQSIKEEKRHLAEDVLSGEGVRSTVFDRQELLALLN